MSFPYYVRSPVKPGMTVFRFIGVKIYKSFEYLNIRRFFPTLVIVSVRFLILCNNDFGVIVKIVINENGNYFLSQKEQPP